MSIGISEQIIEEATETAHCEHIAPKVAVAH